MIHASLLYFARRLLPLLYARVIAFEASHQVRAIINVVC